MNDLKIMSRFFAFLSFFVAFSVANGQFTNEAAANQMTLINNNPLFGNGLTFIDFDLDGLDDITFASRNQGVKFFINVNGESFQPITLTFTPAIPNNIDIKSILWVDYDNDGDLDFIYSGILNGGLGNYPLKLYNNNGNLEFTDVSIASGILPEIPQIFGVSAGDYDNDGFLDLFVCKYHNSDFFEGYEYSNRLYHNEGDGTFTDATLSTGLPTPVQASFSSVFFDYDRDGWQDIYVINDRPQYPNYLYHNLGGYFEDVTTTSGAGVHIEAMSNSIADYDRDGDQDIYCSNTTTGNVLLNNQNDGSFIDAASFAGIEVFLVCWGSLWLDYDNDGWEDLFIPTVGNGFTVSEQNFAFKNEGDGTFSNVTSALGLSNNNDGTYCMAQGDFNNDGYYDFIQNNTATATDFYVNSGGENNYFCCTFEGTISNKDGIGTWIDCWSDNGYQCRYTFCGENYMGQNSKKEIFGLGTDEIVDSLKVTWLSGLEEMYYNLEVNQCMHFVEGASTSSLPASLSYTNDLIICPGESVTFTADEALSYLWSNGSTEQSIVISEPDTIALTITNEFGLEQFSAEYIISWAPIPEWTESISNVTCFGLNTGSASIQLNEEDISSIVWENGAETSEITELIAGTYSYTLTDNQGCLHTDSLTISEPEALTLEISSENVLCYGDNSGSAAVIVSGGNGEPYNINWGEGIDPTALTAAEYTVSITDPLNCEISGTFSISEPEELSATVTSSLIDEDNPLAEAELFIQGGTPPYDISWSNGASDVTVIDGLNAGYNSVLVEDSNNCSIEIIFEVLVGIGELQSNHELVLFPNPAIDVFVLRSPNLMDQIEITDANGKLVKRIQVAPTLSCSIDVSELPSGFYMLTTFNSFVRSYNIPLMIEKQ
jgi:hypothetical protein